jgi:hypothetical protein
VAAGPAGGRASRVQPRSMGGATFASTTRAPIFVFTTSRARTRRKSASSGGNIRKRPSRAATRLRRAALAGFVATAVLTGGPAATVLAAPSDPGDQTTAEQRIIDGYVAKQRGCTPDLAPSPQGVTWDSPGFTPNAGGTGTVRMPIHDWAANFAPTGWTAAGTLCIGTAEGPRSGRSRHTAHVARNPVQILRGCRKVG